jgi:hypothetical protein
VHHQTLALISFHTFTGRIAESESERRSGETSEAVAPPTRPLTGERVHLSMPPSSLLSAGPLFQLLDMARERPWSVPFPVSERVGSGGV